MGTPAQVSTRYRELNQRVILLGGGGGASSGGWKADVYSFRFRCPVMFSLVPFSEQNGFLLTIFEFLNGLHLLYIRGTGQKTFVCSSFPRLNDQAIPEVVLGAKQEEVSAPLLLEVGVGGAP